MKPSFLIFGLLICTLSCQKTQDEVGNVCKEVSFFVPAFKDSGSMETKTDIVNGTDFVWSDADTVGIYPNSGGQVFFPISGGAGAQYASFDGGGWEFRPSALYSGYYPFDGDMYLKRNHIPVSYRFQRQNGINSTSHLGAKDFMYTAPTASTSGSLSFSFNHLSCIIRPRLTLPAGTYTKLSIVIDEPLFALEGYYSLEDENPAIIGTSFSNTIDLMLDNVTLTAQTQFLTYIMAAPVELTGKKMSVIVYDDKGYQYVYTKTPSYTYSAGTIGGLGCADYVSSPVSSVIIGVHPDSQMNDDQEGVHF